ncbi:MAG: hypothetical protein RIR96_325 [Bacteroidota bacterium]
MNKKIQFTGLLFTLFCHSNQSFAQSDTKNDIRHIFYVENPEENTLYSIPCYDSLGNVFQVKKRFDHKPNFTDSVEFSRIIPVELGKMFDEYELQQKKEMDSLMKNKPKTKTTIKKKKRIK